MLFPPGVVGAGGDAVDCDNRLSVPVEHVLSEEFRESYPANDDAGPASWVSERGL